jgi:hypothetical protein
MPVWRTYYHIFSDIIEQDNQIFENEACVNVQPVP